MRAEHECIPMQASDGFTMLSDLIFDALTPGALILATMCATARHVMYWAACAAAPMLRILREATSADTATARHWARDAVRRRPRVLQLATATLAALAPGAIEHICLDKYRTTRQFTRLTVEMAPVTGRNGGTHDGTANSDIDGDSSLEDVAQETRLMQLDHTQMPLKRWFRCQSILWARLFY